MDNRPETKGAKMYGKRRVTIDRMGTVALAGKWPGDTGGSYMPMGRVIKSNEGLQVYDKASNRIDIVKTQREAKIVLFNWCRDHGDLLRDNEYIDDSGKVQKNAK
jgi:hypothetical protein